MPVIATAKFSDASTRAIYKSEDRLFVIDDDGKWVYGVWVIPRDECDTPVVVGDVLPANW